MPTDGKEINFCGKNKFLGCSPRPTLEHSKLTLAADSKVFEDFMGVKYVSAQVNIVEANELGAPKFIDADGSNVCKDLKNNKYYKCSADGVLSNNIAKLPFKFKRRLPIPKISDSSLIREYYPITSIPPYKQGTTSSNYAAGKASCQEGDNKDDKKDVYYGFDGNFYLLDNAGKVTSQQTKKSVLCEVEIDGDAQWYDSQKKLKPGAEGVNNGLQIYSTDPDGYTRDTKKFYGVDFKAAIPGFNSDGSVSYARYTSAKDFPPAKSDLLSSEPVKSYTCIPTRLTDICDTKGTTHFIPAGDRGPQKDRYCAKVPDQTNDKDGYPDNDPKCAPLGRGSNDPFALNLYCPGVVKSTYEGRERVCLEPSAGDWAFKTKGEYLLNDLCKIPVKDDYCSPLTVAAITTINKSSGFTTWPEGAANTTQIGTCDISLGYINRKILTLITQTQEDICATGSGSGGPITGNACKNAYNQYLSKKQEMDKVIEVKTLKTADQQERNLTLAEITSLLNTAKDLLDTLGMIEGKDYMIVDSPPTRTIDRFGKTTIDNGCVKIL